MSDTIPTDPKWLLIQAYYRGAWDLTDGQAVTILAMEAGSIEAIDAAERARHIIDEISSADHR